MPHASASVLLALSAAAVNAFQPGTGLPLRCRTRLPQSRQTSMSMVIMLPPSSAPLAGDVGSVFKERLIDSFGQLPTAHAPTHMGVSMVIMTLVPCFLLLAAYLELNKRKLQPEAVFQTQKTEIFDDDYMFYSNDQTTTLSRP